MSSKRFLQIVLYKVQANLRSEVSRYYLNYFWWAIEPILSMLVFYVVFGVLLQRGTQDYVAFLLVGTTAWLWFNRSINNGSMSIMSARSLMSQIRITKVFFPTVIVLQDFFKHSIVTVLLLGFLILHGVPVTVTWIAFPALVMVQLVLVAGCATLTAGIVPFLPDIRYLVSSFLRLLFFGTGVFFDLERVVSEQYRTLAYLNPMAGLLKNYRQVLLHGQWPDWRYVFVVGLFAAGLYAAAIALIRRLDPEYARVVI